MALDTTLQRTQIDNLCLDPRNPRLGRRGEGQPSQDDILKEMRSFNLEELAHSFIEAKTFWPQEAVIVVKEDLYKKDDLIVVEGNRRIATLKWLQRTIQGEPPRKKWTELFPESSIPTDLFDSVPYFVADDRSDVDDYIAFRHVTGVRQWAASDKAYFIAQLLERGEDFEEVRKAVGSTTPAVKSNYLAYRLLLQMEDEIEDFDTDRAKNRFTVLYMTLKSEIAKSYLGIDKDISPTESDHPVSEEHYEHLENFSRWLYGDTKSRPMITDTRQIKQLTKALSVPEALEYLERTRDPKLELALQHSGAEEEQLIENVKSANDYTSLALGTAHRYKSSNNLKSEVEKLHDSASQLKKVITEE